VQGAERERLFRGPRRVGDRLAAQLAAVEAPPGFAALDAGFAGALALGAGADGFFGP
jgi:hypothetical protein